MYPLCGSAVAAPAVLAGPCVLKLRKRPSPGRRGPPSALERAVWGVGADDEDGRGGAREALRRRFAEAHLGPRLGTLAAPGTPCRVAAAFARRLLPAHLAAEDLEAADGGGEGAAAGGAVRGVLQRDCSVVSAVPGLAAGRTLCLEIKPKCGFLPAPELLHGPYAVQARVSRYALHQRLKVQQGRVARPSAYCPLDLFSRDRPRVARALRALVASPQNNLMVFADGRRALDLASGSTGAPEMAGEGEEPPVAFARLCGAFWGAGAGAADDAAAERVLDAVATILCERSDAPGRVLDLQRLDRVGPFGAARLLWNLAGRRDEGLPADAGLRAEVTAAAGLAPAVLALDRLPREAGLRLLREYLIAATAKDCALMVALGLPGDAEGGPPAAVAAEPEAGAERGALEVGGRRLLYSVTLVDLDLKPLAKVHEHAALDRRLVALHAGEATVQ